MHTYIHILVVVVLCCVYKHVPNKGGVFTLYQHFVTNGVVFIVMLLFFVSVFTNILFLEVLYLQRRCLGGILFTSMLFLMVLCLPRCRWCCCFVPRR